jgi:hypothetical protein
MPGQIWQVHYGVSFYFFILLADGTCLFFKINTVRGYLQKAWSRGNSYRVSLLTKTAQPILSIYLSIHPSIHPPTIYKTYLATNSTHQQTPDYQRMFRMRLQFRLHLEMHHSIWQHNIETFTGYWLHRHILGKIQEGRIVLNDHI